MKSVTLYKYVLLIGIITSSVYSQQIEPINQPIKFNSEILTDSAIFQDTTDQRLENYWGLYLGYFPDTNDEFYASNGFGAILNMENYSGNLLNVGWYFIFRKTFKDNEESEKTGSASLGTSLSYHFSNKPNTLLVKIGLGLRTPPYVQVSTLFVLEYQFQFSENLIISIALTEEIIQFSNFSSPLISIGIVI